jgi:hypothetical protein
MTVDGDSSIGHARRPPARGCGVPKRARRLAAVAAAAGLALLDAGSAGATPPQSATARAGAVGDPRPPERPLEASLAVGYAQAFGGIGGSLPKLEELGRAGAAAQLGFAVRLFPALALGGYAYGAQFKHGDGVDPSSSVTSAAIGAQADVHLCPDRRWDPWISLGVGYRGYWINAIQGMTSLAGMDLARARIGVDFHAADEVAVTPVLGVDLSEFFGESIGGGDGYHAIDSPRVNATVFAGVMARFELASKTPPASQVVSR